MQIHAGYDLQYDCTQPTPMLLVLSVHPSRFADLTTPHRMKFDPPIPFSNYHDAYGNICTRIVAPAGRLRITSDFQISDSGQADEVAPHAGQVDIADLPEDVILFLLGSRYCDTDHLSDLAWAEFGNTPPGWARVQAICSYVHERIDFNYQNADSTRTARDGYQQRTGVCRDFAHLAITLCRCMNIPARYCTGYLGDIGVPKDGEMDFSAWFEAYLNGRWYTFDARHNFPRIGRILMARGRDATDVALSTSFGHSTLSGFKVITDEVPEVQ
ncbi:transglutaminase family protein [Afifella sp. IM 167]|uniref:transglutaminase-like domain-containing protein n=1 Tax=Afifella sp. IM 167 TaxID=2033586 RepID=UPI001CCA9407|nr:transglutaminase family protein [Afifella sp. IM 167]MBZ8135383.1 transglutaminase [Afifella sp. IM 167]